jgi:SAM-dependent methyltransferase
MHIEFADYLEAKFPLDERSLNADVRQACFERLGRKRGVLHCLDVGTGTGAMVRRLIDSGLHASFHITALDRDASLLKTGSVAVAAQLERLGYRARSHATGIEAEHQGRQIRVDWLCRSLFEFEPANSVRYDLITAHGLMDIVPMARTLSLFRAWLAEQGVFYATLNYDGDTALFPLYRDPAFESAVLAEYDASMERRRVQGEATGGARSGRRLHAGLAGTGFGAAAYGSSDWNLTPREGRYRDRDADVLRTLLCLIRGESEPHTGIDRESLARWYAERSAQLDSGELGMIVHQLDIVATRRQSLSAFT